jgi:hypothetical protein
VLLLTALALLCVILPCVGLAIDAAVLYAVKARLQTATDGAALAAARSLSRGLDLASQQSSAQETAGRFFAANISSGWMGLSSPTLTVAFPAAPPKTTIVGLVAAVDAPTYFMRIFGLNSVHVTAVGSASRRDVNIVLVTDRSGSLQNSGSCASLREAAKSFADSFVDGRDRLGLVTFGTTYRSDFDPAFDFKSRPGASLDSVIDNVVCIGGTNSAAAYWLGYQKLLAINEPGTLNVILFFTDGQPNTLHMDKLQIKTTSPCQNKTDKIGVITPAGTSVWGIFLAIETGPPPAPNPDWRLISGSGGCSYAGNFANVPTDVTALTKVGSSNETDINGNSLVGYKTPIRRDGSSRIRIDDYETITNTGINALDNAAQRVRTESAVNKLSVITYCIGLGGPGAAEDRLMRRIANVLESDIYDASKPTGMYVYASDASQLQQAFQSLASDILRISR